MSNMIHAHLVNRDERGWVDVLPGIMLAYNEMEQGQHGYSASQLMWGQGMNLPADLLHGTRSGGEQDRHQFIKNMGKELREIQKKVNPFNKNKEKVAINPFKEGDLILIHQQPMERMHKLSPKWWDPYKVTKVPNPFQVQYEDEEREKLTHVRNCKKFCGQVNDGNEQPITNKGCLRHAKVQCQVRQQRRMSCHIIDILAEGSKWTFQNPAHFCKWLREREENSANINIRGVPAQRGQGNTEVAEFLAKRLRLPKPLYRWQRRKLARETKSILPLCP